MMPKAGMMQVHALRIPAFVLSAALIAGATFLPAEAEDPPEPDFFWPYGIVQRDGLNIEPPQQTVLALVNGTVCGTGTTTIAPNDLDTPPGDVGKTVYVLNVLAGGSASGDLPGCGHIGDPVTLYFPASAAIAGFHPTFQVGGLRVDLDLTQPLDQHLTLGLAASDGSD